MSAEIKDGGPAFPRQHVVADANDRAFKLGSAGMSLRDYFAANALQGLLSHPTGRKAAAGQSVVEAHAVAAYEYADAMLAAREKP